MRPAIAMKPSRSRFLPVRGLRYHLREWGEPGAPQLLLLHGWMDVSASFQFVVDALRRDWHVIAPDWRGFGLKDCAPELAPGRYARWLDQLKSPPASRRYPTRAEVAERLRRNNSRLDEPRAAFLAEHWSRRTAQGDYEIAGDPAHKIVNPVLYRWAEVAACWAAVACPVLWVEAADTDAHRWAGDAGDVARRVAALKSAEIVRVADAGHMLHHDQPQVVARLIEEFVERAGRPAP